MSCVNPNVLKMLDREELVVNITVFSPTDFLSARNGTVFFNVLKRTHFQSAGDFHFDVYGKLGYLFFYFSAIVFVLHFGI